MKTKVQVNLPDTTVIVIKTEKGYYKGSSHGRMHFTDKLCEAAVYNTKFQAQNKKSFFDSMTAFNAEIVNIDKGYKLTFGYTGCAQICENLDQLKTVLEKTFKDYDPTPVIGMLRMDAVTAYTEMSKNFSVIKL